MAAPRIDTSVENLAGSPHLQTEDTSGQRRKQRRRPWLNPTRFRWISQIAFMIVLIFIGCQFYFFVRYCETGGTSTLFSRPPGIEACLPIGAFMSLKYFLGTGKVDPVHPAGFIIFASILLTSFLFQRGFCSWICPVGTISEWAWRLGDWIKSKFNKTVRYWVERFPVKLTCGLSMITTPIIVLMILEVISFSSFKSLYIFSHTLFYVMISFIGIALIAPFALPRKMWPSHIEDSIARAWKYSIFAFFAVSILIKMPAQQLEIIFTRAPYMKVADVMMLNFFRNLSLLAIIVLSLLFLFSIFNKNYWCRYFCPYGAIIGVLGWASTFRIVRDSKTCIDCGKCTKACPVLIEVDKKKNVYSQECWACYDCVDVCPVSGALDMKIVGIGKKVHYAVYAGLVVGLFVIFMNTARFTGHWHNKVTLDEYMYRISEIDDPKYKHKQGKFEIE